ncbi:hypothetical protein NYE44_30470 [Paenibacillus sp. FSL L8-0493]|uniref:hypothetical protein n=1 Tax=Paenibacillus sp. FSL L8-0493 TaxID=2975333 RepID=UPI0030FDB8F9
MITKSIDLTLHESVWKALECDIEASGGNVNIAELLRAVVTESYWSKMELMGLELPVYKGSNESAAKLEEVEKGKEIGYTGEECGKCGRVRVMLFENGDQVCEKCGWNETKQIYEQLNYY